MSWSSSPVPASRSAPSVPTQPADADLRDQRADFVPAQRIVAHRHEGVVEVAVVAALVIVRVGKAGEAVLEGHHVDPRRSSANARAFSPATGLRKLNPSRLPTAWKARIGSRLPSSSVTTGAIPSKMVAGPGV